MRSRCGRGFGVLGSFDGVRKDEVECTSGTDSRAGGIRCIAGILPEFRHGIAAY